MAAGDLEGIIRQIMVAAAPVATAGITLQAVVRLAMTTFYLVVGELLMRLGDKLQMVEAEKYMEALNSQGMDKQRRYLLEMLEWVQMSAGLAGQADSVDS